MNILRRIFKFVFGPRKKKYEYAIITLLRPEGGTPWYPQVKYLTWTMEEEPSLEKVKKDAEIYGTKAGWLKGCRVVERVCKADDYDKVRKEAGIVTFSELENELVRNHCK